MRSASVKQHLGALLFDLPRFVWSMRPSTHGWTEMRNRGERLLSGEEGVSCDWQWTSDLHVARMYPALGRILMRRALRYWPIDYRERPRSISETPDITFVIGHRGVERLPHLQLTLKAIAAQREASVECVVVEQSSSALIKDHLPGWVRYTHTPVPDESTPYCRSWAFNVGVRLARGGVVVLHDNDILVPTDYAREVIRRVQHGFEVVDIKRLIFFLSEQRADRLVNPKSLIEEVPETIMQNAQGGSLAITREAYLEIGGFDESFVGWGGEDNEFWERAKTRAHWSFGYLPLVHLWHTAQSDKHNPARATARLLEDRSALSPSQRIAELRNRDFGNRIWCMASGRSSRV